MIAGLDTVRELRVDGGEALLAAVRAVVVPQTTSFSISVVSGRPSPMGLALEFLANDMAGGTCRSATTKTGGSPGMAVELVHVPADPVGL